MKREIEEVVGIDCSNAIMVSAKQVHFSHHPKRQKACSNERSLSEATSLSKVALASLEEAKCSLLIAVSKLLAVRWSYLDRASALTRP